MAAGTFQGANEFNEDDNQVFHTHEKKKKKNPSKIWNKNICAIQELFANYHSIFGICYLVFPLKLIS